MPFQDSIKENSEERQFRLEVAEKITNALQQIERLVDTETLSYADEGINWKRGYYERRKYTLKDAKANAKLAAMFLRQAWDLLDPPTPSPFK